VKNIFLALLVCLCSAAPSFARQRQPPDPNQPYQCERNTEDMLLYFLMDYPDRIDHSMGIGIGALNSNPIYSSITPEIASAGYTKSGTFIWTKTPSGYPWDVRTYDGDYIYDRATELLWTDPTSFKRFTQDMPIAPRCASTRSDSDTIKTKQKSSGYSFYANCAVTKSADLGYVTNTVSKPVSVDTGGNLGVVKTRTLTYTYACNSKYQQCGYMEVFSLGYNVGLYDWKYYTAQSGKWVLMQDSVINNFTLGQSVPMFTCPNTYQ
jgi:hypothetical protein